MQFTLATAAAAILALTNTVSALPLDARDTAAVNMPYAAEAVSSDAPFQLPTFNVWWWGIQMAGLTVTTFGKYGQCYNLKSPFISNVGSIDMTKTKAPGCWVYKATDCQGAYKIVQAPAGTPINEGGIGSFICDAPTS